jgi:hypothetical protein
MNVLCDGCVPVCVDCYFQEVSADTAAVPARTFLSPDWGYETCCGLWLCSVVR